MHGTVAVCFDAGTVEVCFDAGSSVIATEVSTRPPGRHAPTVTDHDAVSPDSNPSSKTQAEPQGSSPPALA